MADFAGPPLRGLAAFPLKDEELRMNRMDTRGPSVAGRWKRWIIGAVPAAAIVAAVLVFRSTNPPAQAQAQAPVKNAPLKSAPIKSTASAPGAASAGTPA